MIIMKTNIHVVLSQLLDTKGHIIDSIDQATDKYVVSRDIVQSGKVVYTTLFSCTEDLGREIVARLSDKVQIVFRDLPRT